ncbi:hypothetical protein N8476_01665 [Akkermansiaceae bacterium]|nr:hypothetical protein [Akkermansiaceae bacterium]
MLDTLYDGKRFRTLNVLGKRVRETLAIEVDISLRQKKSSEFWGSLKTVVPCPCLVRYVWITGPELISAKLVTWCEQHQINLHYI